MNAMKNKHDTRPTSLQEKVPETRSKNNRAMHADKYRRTERHTHTQHHEVIVLREQLG